MDAKPASLVVRVPTTSSVVFEMIWNWTPAAAFPLAVVGLPAVVLAALGLGNLDIERDGVLLEVVLRLKIDFVRRNHGIGTGFLLHIHGP